MILILIKGTLVNYFFSIPVDLDAIVIINVYLIAKGSETGAGIFALGQGLLTDILSGGIWGFHAILYVIIFLFIRFLSGPFDLMSTFGQIALISISILAKDLLRIPLLHLFSLNTNISFYDLLIYMVSALFSGLVAPLIFYLLSSVGRPFRNVKEKYVSTV
jgi:rod shape-determining protein MreD